MELTREIAMYYAVLAYAWTIYGIASQSIDDHIEGNGEENITSADWYFTLFAPIAMPIVFIKMFAHSINRYKK